MYDKEQIYDEQINPLMAKIIEICKENDIQVIATFALKEEDEEGSDLHATTYIPSKEYKSQRLLDAYNVIKNGYVVERPFYMTAVVSKE